MSTASESMKKLRGTGKVGDARAFIRKEAEQSAGRYKQVLDDESLSETGKRQQLAALYQGARKRVDQELERMANSAIRTDRDDAERVFGIKGLPGDTASLTISRRDASDRVAAVETEADLRDLLARATRSGDEVLARAVAERALEKLDDTTLHQFLNDRPELDSAVERLWNLQRAENDSLNDTMLLLDLAPVDMQGMSRDELEELASTPPDDAGAKVPALSWIGEANEW